MQNPGLLPTLRLDEFGPKEREIVHNLSTIWFVANAKIGKIGKDKFPYLFLKPTDALKERFNFFSNILCVLHPYPIIDGRIIDLIDRVLSSNPNRLDRLCILLISNASEVDIGITKINADNEARIIVPFKYNEISGGVAGKSDLIRKRLEENLFTRNLFAISSALKTDRYFFGRKQDIQSLIGKYQSGENSAIFGLRRIGKTSVLWAVVRELRAMKVPVAFVDCSDTRYHKARWNQTLFRVKQAVFEANGLSNAGHEQSHYSEENASISFTEDLNLLKKTFGKPALLIFDEIESLCFDLSPTNHWSSGADYLAFWQTLRSTFQQNPNLFSFLICGVNPKALETPIVASGNDNPLYRYIEPSYLGFFDVNDVTQMLNNIGGYMGMAFDQEIFTYLTDDFGGHPFLIRQVCSQLYKLQTKRDLPRKIVVKKEFYRDKLRELSESTVDYVNLILLILKDRYTDEYKLLQYLAANDHETFSMFAKEDKAWIHHLIGYGLITYALGKYHFRINVVKLAVQAEIKHLHSPDTVEERWELLSETRNKFEAKFRESVRSLLKIGLGQVKAKEAIISAMMKVQQRDKAKALPYDGIFSGELYFSDLKRVVSSEWDIFKNIFDSDKEQFEICMTQANKNRADAHAKGISKEEFDETMLSLNWLSKCLDDNC